MEFAEYFPIWDKLTPSEKERLSRGAVLRQVKKGALLHNGSMDCLGLLLVREGQLRAYIYSDTGREVTIYRLFERDICLFSASCIMQSIQFDITIEAEKDSLIWVIPPELYKDVMEHSAPLANYTSQIMASRFTELLKRGERTPAGQGPSPGPDSPHAAADQKEKDTSLPIQPSKTTGEIL